MEVLGGAVHGPEVKTVHRGGRHSRQIGRRVALVVVLVHGGPETESFEALLAVVVHAAGVQGSMLAEVRGRREPLVAVVAPETFLAGSVQLTHLKYIFFLQDMNTKQV